MASITPNAAAIAAGASATIQLGSVQQEPFEDDSGIIPISEIAQDGVGSDQNEGFQLFAPSRNLNIAGIKFGTISELRTFYNDIRICQKYQDTGGAHTYNSDFTGGTIKVKVIRFAPVYKAGLPLELEYQLALFEVKE